MRFSGFNGKGAAAAVITCFCLWFGTAVAAAGQSVEVRLEPRSVTASPTVSNATYLMLRIVTPSGTHAGDFQSQGAPILWSLPEKPENGTYRYEVRVGTAQKQTRGDASQRQPGAPAQVTSGSFRVSGNKIVIFEADAEETGMLEHLGTQALTALAWVMDALATPAHADIVHQDDTIIQFSGCIGNDCVNGESFGFDTLRLKENNLRIHFQDTSTSASFPTRDWRIVINDTAKGGANFFAIEDSDAGRRPFTLEAGAPANSLYLAPSGNIGLGTATPLALLHLLDGNTPTIRLEQDGSAGFSPYSWDLSANENSFFIKNGITNTIPFSLDAATGSLGLGTEAPRAKFELLQTNKDAEFLVTRKQVTEGEADKEVFAKLEATADTVRLGSVSATPLLLMTGDSPHVTVDTNGNMGIGTTAPTKKLHVAGDALISGNLELGSSRELKFKITPLSLDEATKALKALDPMRYRYKSSPDEESLGFIAEDVPDLVATNSRKSVSPMDVVAVLTKVVKEQQETIEKQQATLDALARRVGELEQKNP